jgi:S1-C subfamily serine protease
MTRAPQRKFTLIAAVVVAALAGAVVASMFWAKRSDSSEDYARDPGSQPLEIRGWWLGIAVTGTDTPTARKAKIPSEMRGVVVVEVTPQEGWRAQRGGLQAGDVIRGANGKSVGDIGDFRDVTAKIDANQSIMLEIDRRGQPMTVLLPAVAAVAPAVPGGQPAAADIRTWWLGIALTDTDTATAKSAGIPAGAKGVMVVEISPQQGARAVGAGLQPGDLIQSVGGQKVSEAEDVGEATAQLDLNQSITLEIDRRGQPLAVVLPPAAMPLQGPQTQAAPPAVPAPVGPQPMIGNAAYVCPFDGLVWRERQVAPAYRCPKCNGALVKQLQ